MQASGLDSRETFRKLHDDVPSEVLLSSKKSGVKRLECMKHLEWSIEMDVEAKIL